MRSLCTSNFCYLLTEGKLRTVLHCRTIFILALKARVRNNSLRESPHCTSYIRTAMA